MPGNYREVSRSDNTFVSHYFTVHFPLVLMQSTQYTISNHTDTGSHDKVPSKN